MRKPTKTKAHPKVIGKKGYFITMTCDPYERAEAIDAFRREIEEFPELYGNPSPEKTKDFLHRLLNS